MSLARSARLMLVVMATAALAACGINSVPTKEEAAKARWADVESAYQRRADLIPNLVATVRGGAESELAILTEVTEARSRASSVQIDADDLSNPEKFQQFEAAQGELSGALSRLLVTVEAYPQITSSRGYDDLRTALESAENRIDNARTKYNAAVQDYNTEIRVFPSSIGANIIHGAEPMEAFKAEAGANEAPDIDAADLTPTGGN
ncbi:LemA family protein [Alteriqipengyuania flavescens]|uniref:LemA family protein n=1 Tax=Alteriqipengyuania flavescens TaxID=3053610 RepID=UPI0025B6120B|nr:LemA family protein [Alteriqipengyuania flavescens]WJY18963.1 LemA family protein [Alteriqipengyuania flavescens]WJY24903.1 LemA family protein [Alteriqipengyuania flavescens]